MVGLSPEAAFDELGAWPGVLSRLLVGEDLSTDEARTVMDQVFSGAATPVQIAGFMTALRAKGETVEEITGLVRAMLAHAEPVVIEGDVLDMVGTGGDRLRSFNVTTLAALVTAGAGVPVCKHGNRAASSSVGTADVLEALGVVIDLGPTGVARCVTEAGMGFCFAQRFYPAMRFAAPVRRELGVPTVFNFLGPLANPARARLQVLGVNDPAMALKMAGVLGANGSRRAMVVYADDGLDELSVTSPSTIVELVGDGQGTYELATRRLDPTDLGLTLGVMDDLRGGDAAFNAEVIRRILAGEQGPRRDIGILNAAAGLVVAGRADDLASGIVLAARSIDEGWAARALADLVTVSQAARADELAAAPGPD